MRGHRNPYPPEFRQQRVERDFAAEGPDRR